MRSKQYLRRPVPSSRNFFSQNDVLVGLISDKGAGESKITDLHGAVAVEQEIGGLEVPMDDLRGMQKLEPLGELVQNEPVMRILEYFLSE